MDRTSWLFGRLRDHGLMMDQRAHRLCRSKSWVSRRLGLLDALVTSAQDRVRAGTVPAQAATKYLVPLARANNRQCEPLIAGLGDTKVTVRELVPLYTAWKRADRAGRQRIVAEPLLVLRSGTYVRTVSLRSLLITCSRSKGCFGCLRSARRRAA